MGVQPPTTLMIFVIAFPENKNTYLVRNKQDQVIKLATLPTNMGHFFQSTWIAVQLQYLIATKVWEDRKN